MSDVVDKILAALHAAGIKAARTPEGDEVFAPAPWATSGDAWDRPGVIVRVWAGRPLLDTPSAVIVFGSPLRRQSYPVKNGAFAVAKVVERVRAGLAVMTSERARRDEADRERQANAKSTEEAQDATAPPLANNLKFVLAPRKRVAYTSPVDARDARQETNVATMDGVAARAWGRLAVELRAREEAAFSAAGDPADHEAAASFWVLKRIADEACWAASDARRRAREVTTRE